MAKKNRKNVAPKWSDLNPLLVGLKNTNESLEEYHVYYGKILIDGAESNIVTAATDTRIIISDAIAQANAVHDRVIKRISKEANVVDMNSSDLFLQSIKEIDGAMHYNGVLIETFIKNKILIMDEVAGEL